MKYVLGIDIGTSNTKAVAYAVDGTVLARTNVGYSFSSTIEGYHEIDPNVLLNAVITVIQKAVRVVSKGQLMAVCFSSAMHGLMAVDQRCAPMTNMITWADLRSSAYAQKLKNTEQGTRIYYSTGTPIHPMSPLCKLMWMKDHLPEVFSAAYKFISIKEYVFFHFFGKYVVDHSIASATGLFDIYTKDWNAEALTRAGVDAARLSTLVPVSYVLQGLQVDYVSRLGIDRGTPFIAGGSDGCLAQLGSNALKKRDVSLTIGTSAAVRMMVSQPVKDPQQRIFNYLLTDERYIVGGPLNNGGNVLQWFNRNMAGREENTDGDYNWFLEQAASVEPGSGGLIFLPYIYGERAPVWDADARGLFYGINGTHHRANFMRAILEGVSFALHTILQTLEELVGKPGEVYVSGGFTQSEAWVQLLSDVLGRSLKVTQTEDASSAGAALIGMQALGMIPSIEESGTFFGKDMEFVPDKKDQAAYDANYSIYVQLYAALKQIKK